MFHVPEKHRVKTGMMRSTKADGNNGQFMVKSIKLKNPLLTIASDGAGWEHVSVSIPGRKRCPTWKEMSYIKSLFWDEDDMVVQFHPPESEHVNNHPYCLHLWRKCGTNNFCEMPHSLLVGVNQNLIKKKGTA